jgi:hypothetical protein
LYTGAALKQQKLMTPQEMMQQAWFIQMTQQKQHEQLMMQQDQHNLDLDDEYEDEYQYGLQDSGIHPHPYSRFMSEFLHNTQNLGLEDEYRAIRTHNLSLEDEYQYGLQRVHVCTCVCVCDRERERESE